MSSLLESGTHVGHVHLKVSDLDRSIEFYRDVIGFELVLRFGAQAAFLSVDGYHHHLGLNTWESEGSPPGPPGHPGLYHFAILLPDRAALARAVIRLAQHGVALSGAADHGVSEAVYLNDPDGNGIELYWDRPRAEWPVDGAGNLTMYSRHLDLGRLLHEVEGRSAEV